MDHIKTHRDYQPLPLRQFVADVRRRKRIAGAPSEFTADAPVVKARINHGSWLADCPYCSGAEMIDLDDLRFWCLSCDMKANGGQWLRVEMPPENLRREIEELVVSRPKLSDCGWTPGETVARLRAENKTLGLR